MAFSLLTPDTSFLSRSLRLIVLARRAIDRRMCFLRVRLSSQTRLTAMSVEALVPTRATVGRVVIIADSAPLVCGASLYFSSFSAAIFTVLSLSVALSVLCIIPENDRAREQRGETNSARTTKEKERGRARRPDDGNPYMAS